LSFDAHRDAPGYARTTASATPHRSRRVPSHYHALMRRRSNTAWPGLSWHRHRPGAHVARAALSYLHHQVEPGTSCPLTMTHAAVPALRRVPPARLGRQGHRLAVRRARSAHWRQPGVTLGMGMTEKQGGSDVRSNTTARRSAGG
jgi:putative acyl-CoA dehydrogenase